MSNIQTIDLVRGDTLSLVGDIANYDEVSKQNISLDGWLSTARMRKGSSNQQIAVLDTQIGSNIGNNTYNFRLEGSSIITSPLEGGYYYVDVILQSPDQTKTFTIFTLRINVIENITV